MTIALAKYLVGKQLVGAAQMDDVLQRQVLFGGSVDTNLLELGLLDEPRLTQALAEVHRLPAATRALLQQRETRVSKLFPARLAQKYQVVPVALSGRSLVLLAAGRVHPVVEDEIGFMLSLAVSTHLVCEARLKLLLRDWLNLEIDPRFEAMADKLGPIKLVFGQGEPPSPAALAIDLAEQTAKKVMGDLSPDVNTLRIQQALTELASTQRVALERRRQSREGTLSMEGARQLCLSALGRDSLVDVILRYSRQFMPFVGLFVLHDEHIQGWDGVGADDVEHRIRRVRLPMDSPSVLRTVVQTQAYYLGTMPSSKLDDELLQMLGRARPRNVLIVPILVQGRMVGLLFGDAGRRSIRGRRIADLLVFVSGLSSAFEVLIRKRKQTKQAKQTAQALAEAAVATPPTEMPTPIEDEPETAEGKGQEVVWDESFGDLDDEHPVIEADVLGFPAPVREALPEAEGIRGDEQRVRIEDLGEEEEGVSSSVLAGEGGDVVVVDTDGSFSPPEPEVVLPTPLLAPGLAGLPSLIEDLSSGDVARMDQARQEIGSLGLSALPELMKHFPGHLLFDVRGRYDQVPPLVEHGPLLRFLVDLGIEASPYVGDRLEDDDPVARYYAVRFFAAVRDDSVVPRLATRLYDRDALVRLNAIDVLVSYRGADSFNALLLNLRHRLRGAVPDQQAIASALLGNFKDVDAVDDLIALVKSSDKMVARAAQESLSYITKQDFGHNLRKWSKWQKAHKGESRMLWLIEGLRSKSRDVRFSSSRELNQLTQEHFDYDYDAKQSDRELACRRWEQWWEKTGSSENYK
ncbi:MAG: hypothetical protein JRF33_13805 [Deltaproteobacteria bacterium]|nr:hypothetical protein [Deltaproteobacteria bacterium]